MKRLLLLPSLLLLAAVLLPSPAAEVLRPKEFATSPGTVSIGQPQRLGTPGSAVVDCAAPHPSARPEAKR